MLGQHGHGQQIFLSYEYNSITETTLNWPRAVHFNNVNKRCGELKKNTQIVRRQHEGSRNVEYANDEPMLKFPWLRIILHSVGWEEKVIMTKH